MDQTEILAKAIEIYEGIEIFKPSITRYQVGPMFSKIVFDRELMAWKVYSTKSNRVGLIGTSNVKGVLLAEVQAGKPEPLESPKQRARNRTLVPQAPVAPAA